MNLSDIRLLNVLLWAAGLTAFIGSLSLLFWFLPGAIPSGTTSGVWAALANDFAQGIFYRPVFDDFGYGGTRYMPVFFVIYGFLISYLHDPVTSGFLLSLTSLAFLEIGIYFLLRETGVRKSIIIPFILLIHASISVQMLTLEVKEAFLATGFNLWGIVFALKHLKTKSRLYLIFSAVFFLGAFFTKFTTLGGLLTVLLYFLIQKKKSSAIYLASLTAIPGAVIIFLVNDFSQNRAFESFQACALGGFNLGYAIKTPLWFATFIIRDPFLMVLLGLAGCLIINKRKAILDSFLFFYFTISFVSTFAIYSSPGTDNNHLIDLLIASTLVLAFEFQKNQNFFKLYNLSFLFIILGTLYTWIPGTISVKDHIEPIGKPTRDTIRFIADRLGPAKENLLSENPLVPLLMGQRPIVMDAYSIRIIAKQSPAIHKDFIRKIENNYFGAIILLDWSGAPLDQLEETMEKTMEKRSSIGVGRFYGAVHFPPGFLELIKKHYFLSFVKRPYVVYEPIKLGS
ncbi:MAG: hypothetical protein IIB46_03895 [Nitrospinae bacterium]|nr:hypothetical protein [Nitrospinota bacterium]